MVLRDRDALAFAWTGLSRCFSCHWVGWQN